MNRIQLVRGTWLSMGVEDVARITDRLYLTRGDRARNLSAFWVLLILSGVIASAGVIADSTATVIGAMIVAPLMTPILGTALAIVLADRRQLGASLGLVLVGALAVVAVGFVLGLTTEIDVVASTNSQVAGRISPRLIDLLAAIATGLVGAFALIRSDVSDTLPGVAIAISLVPPLTVVGLTLESGAGDEALGALLLFGTNVAAIIATGTGLLLLVGLREIALAAGEPVGTLSLRTVGAVAASLAILVVPLGIGSASVLQEQLVVSNAVPVVDDWAAENDYEVSDVALRQGVLHVDVLGTPVDGADAELRIALDRADLDNVDLEVTTALGATTYLGSE